MHANGHHQGYQGADTATAIDSVEFHFEHDKPVQCGSWHQVLTALSSSVEITRAIIGSPAMKALGTIPDICAVATFADGEAVPQL